MPCRVQIVPFIIHCWILGAAMCVFLDTADLHLGKRQGATGGHPEELLIFSSCALSPGCTIISVQYVSDGN
jgi:hypothetical protein